MAIRFHVPMLQALLVAGLTLGASQLQAQSLPYSIEAKQPSRTITPGGYTKFEVKITNESASELQVFVTRTLNNLPDGEWTSSICFNGACYDPAVDTPPEPEKLAPGSSTMLEIAVVGGTQLDSKGQIKVKITTAFGANAVEQEFDVTVSNSSGVEAPAIALAAAYPNPASTFASLPLPSVARAEEMSLELFDIRGEMVADLSAQARTAAGSGADRVRIDLSGVGNGRYLYKLVADGRATAGSLVVVR